MVKNNVYKIYKLYIIKLVYNDWIVLSKVYKKIVEYLNCRLLNCLYWLMDIVYVKKNNLFKILLFNILLYLC